MSENTGSSLFDDYYYQHCCGDPYERNDKWISVFRHFATNIAASTGAKKILDAGCAKGFLVEALRDLGVEAYGIDFSEAAIGASYDPIKPFLRVGSLTDPLNEQYDLIVTIEVIEHIPARQADLAIANICAATSDIIFSSSPFDYDEPTHVNVHPPEHWAAQFARHGFFRDVDFDGSFLTPWTVRFRKKTKSQLELITDYERWVWLARQAELGSRRQAHKVQTELAAQAEKFKVHENLREQVESLSRELERVTQLNRTLEQEAEMLWNSRSGKLVKALRSGASFFRRLR